MKIRDLFLSFKWITRVICILFAAFLGLFAFDTFGPGINFWKALPAFLIHMSPSFLLLIILIFSWNREWLGGVFFLLIAIAYIIWSGKAGNGSHYIDIPLLIISMLYFASWFLRREQSHAEKGKEGY